MDSEALHKIQVSSTGLQGSSKPVEAKIAPHGYTVAVEGDNLVCYKLEKKGGFIGIGARQTGRPVLHHLRPGCVIVPRVGRPRVYQPVILLLKGH